MGRLSLLLLACALAAGCLSSPPPPGQAPGSAAPAPAASAAVAPASAAREPGYIEQVTGGASPDEALPMIVALHGLGDRPESFAHLLDGLGVKARVIAARGLEAYGPGFSWFPVELGEARRERGIAQAADVNAAADGVAALLRRLPGERPTVGRPIVLGFSQGGMLTFALAARHPGLLGAAFPIGGALFEEAPAPPPGLHLVAFHGEADARVAPDSAKAAVGRWRAGGADAAIKLYPGVGHQITAELRAELHDELRRAVEAAR